MVINRSTIRLMIRLNNYRVQNEETLNIAGVLCNCLIYMDDKILLSKIMHFHMQCVLLRSKRLSLLGLYTFLKAMELTTVFLLWVLLLDKTAFNRADFQKNAEDIKSEGEIKEYSEAILQKVLEEFNVLREEIASMRDTQHLMQNELVVFKEKLSVSLEQGKKMDQDNLKLRLENENLIKQIENITLDKNSPNERLRHVEMTKRSTLSSSAGPSTTSPVAFYAVMNGNDIANIHNSQVLVYDNIHVNSLNAYNKHNGKFTAPVKGIYVFFANVLTFLGKKLEALIVRNGVNFCNIYAGDGTGYGSGSNMAVVALEVGDVVWVKVHVHDPDVHLDGPWTSFSGFLLYDTSEHWIHVEP